MANFQPVDPVALGLCKQLELDSMVAKSSKKSSQIETIQKNDNSDTLVSTESSLLENENKVPSNMAGLEDFSLNSVRTEEKDPIDPDSLFSLPNEIEDKKNHNS